MIEHDFAVRSTGGRVEGAAPARYGGVSIDSRLAKRGDLFFAINARRDGHDFVRAAFEVGASAAVVERRPEGVLPLGAPLIFVPSTVRALGDLALAHRRRFENLKIICITGSNGKTTVKEALAGILKISGRRAAVSRKSFNNHLGLPLTFLEITERHEVCVAEIGVSAPGEMERLAEIAAPDIAAVTNIGGAHIGNFGSAEKIAEEKSQIFSRFGKRNVMAVNLDDPLTREISRRFGCEKIGFGVKSPSVAVSAFGIKSALRSMSFTMKIGGRIFPVTAPAVGAHNVMNFLCAACLALALGCRETEIAEGIENFTPAPMRMEICQVMGGVTLISDCYNANPDSVSAAIDELCRLKKSEKKDSRAIAVLGDMLELGSLSAASHRAVARKAAACGVDFLIAFGDLAREMRAEGEGMSVQKTASHSEAAGMVAEIAQPGDVILIKGSRTMEMEKITQKLKNFPEAS